MSADQSAPPPYSEAGSSAAFPADGKTAMKEAMQASQNQSVGGPSSSSSYAPVAYPPPQAPVIPYQLSEDMERFRDVIGLYEISHLMASKLRALDAYDIVLICDDSGSMRSPSAQGLGARVDPYAPKSTRWDELRYVVNIISAIATTLDEDGIDIYFLNRLGLRNVKNPSQIEQAFHTLPSGGTPINSVLRRVLSDKRPVYASPESSKKLLIILATDGEPTDEAGISTLRHILTNERQPIDRVHVIFVACTDDDNAIAYLNQWDTSIKNVDVIDDYWNERREVLRVQGEGFMFSKGDWVCKILLGSVDTEIDHLDEWRVGTRGSGVGGGGGYVGSGVQQQGGHAGRTHGHGPRGQDSSGCCALL
ncbi:hypothetical protein HDV00_007448 [Rhizophlyctis rosea]|nr:hypothetical protein HDV00_007448 [Rhizophlyctis rosea]